MTSTYPGYDGLTIEQWNARNAEVVRVFSEPAMAQIFENVRKSLLELHSSWMSATYGMFPELDAIVDDFEAKLMAAKRT